jgi:cold shock protein
MESNKDSKVYSGKTIFFNNKTGYGFISWAKEGVTQKDIFVHYSDIQVSGFKTLQKDQMVEFQIGVNHRGDPKAINVTVIKN